MHDAQGAELPATETGTRLCQDIASGEIRSATGYQDLPRQAAYQATTVPSLRISVAPA